MEAFVACKLIPLDKNSSLRAIGWGKVVPRIAEKVVMWIVEKDAIKAAECLQPFNGQKAGSEAPSMLCTKHSMTLRLNQYYLLRLKMHAITSLEKYCFTMLNMYVQN